MSLATLCSVISVVLLILQHKNIVIVIIIIIMAARRVSNALGFAAVLFWHEEIVDSARKKYIRGFVPELVKLSQPLRSPSPNFAPGSWPFG